MTRKQLIEMLSSAPPRDPSACEHCGAVNSHRSEHCIFGPREQQERFLREAAETPLAKEVVRIMSALRRKQRARSQNGIVGMYIVIILCLLVAVATLLSTAFLGSN